MPKVSPHVLREVEDALEQYRKEVDATEMRQSAKTTYLLHSRNFVRWLDDDFTPGAALAERRHL